MAIGPKLPLSISDKYGAYNLNETLLEEVQQNLKNLVLTEQGTRIMDPTFGVGLRSFLFENNSNDTYLIMNERIRSQAGKYLPFIEIENIDFNGPNDNVINSDPNFIHVSIQYKVLPLDASLILNIIEEVK